MTVMVLGFPSDLTWYKLLTDWGSAIGGVVALIAGIVAYSGASRAATRQVRAIRRRDRLQARGIVVAVYPELLSIQVQRERASKIITENLPAVRGGIRDQIVAVIRSARIALPPLLSRNVDNFFLVEPGAASLLQVVSFTLQYNDLIDALAVQIFQRVDDFDPPVHRRDLAGHLTAIELAVKDALKEIGPIHDEATG